MGRFEDAADASLEEKGVEPPRPLILFLMDKIVNDIYDNFYEKKHDCTIAECQRKALDITFKHTSVLKIEEWRADYKRDGYVMMCSPTVGRFYMCRDKQAFDLIVDNGLAVYMESELRFLKQISREDLLLYHEAKQIFKGRIIK